MYMCLICYMYAHVRLPMCLCRMIVIPCSLRDAIELCANAAVEHGKYVAHFMRLASLDFPQKVYSSHQRSDILAHL